MHIFLIIFSYGKTYKAQVSAFTPVASGLICEHRWSGVELQGSDAWLAGFHMNRLP